VATTPGGDESGYASLAELERFAGATTASLDLAAEGRSSLAWQHDGTTDTAWVLFVTDNYFPIVRPAMLMGLPDVRRAAAGPPRAVVAERFWRDALASRPLEGLTLRLNHRDVAVTGVVREAFTGPGGLYSPDVWLPLADAADLGTPATLQRRDARWLFVFGRLSDSASPAAVEAQIAAAAADMAREWPDTHAGRGAAFWMLDRGNSELRGLRTAAAIAMGIIGVVLLLACFNVANLLLARVVERERDLCVLTALGAPRGRIVAGVVCQGLVLAFVGGILATVVAQWTAALVRAFAIPIDQPQHVDLALDGRVLFFVGGLVVAAGLLPSVWPAFAASRLDVTRVLGSHGVDRGTSRPSRLRRGLVAAQVAGSMAFLTLAALLIQSYGHLSGADLGFDLPRLVVADVEPAANGYDAARARRYVEQVATRLGGLPAVSGVAVADRAPFFIGSDRTSEAWPDGRPCAPGPCATYPAYAVSSTYFSTMGIPMIEGRPFANDEPGVVVNALLAQALWPGGSAVGRTLGLGASGRPMVVTGVTADTRTRGLDRPQPVLYRPLEAEAFEREMSFIVRGDAPAATLVRAIREAALDVDPNVAVISVRTMAERTAVQLWPFRTASALFGICGTLALILATVGLAAVILHAVGRRTREFGVRLSIGASRFDLALEAIRGGGRMLAWGLLAGMLLAALVARLARVAFYGVDTLDPTTYVIVAALHALVALVACLWPAWRASRVDPLVALRAE
jgi:predicted permease